MGPPHPVANSYPDASPTLHPRKMLPHVASGRNLTLTHYPQSLTQSPKSLLMTSSEPEIVGPSDWGPKTPHSQTQLTASCSGRLHIPNSCLLGLKEENKRESVLHGVAWRGASHTHSASPQADGRDKIHLKLVDALLMKRLFQPFNLSKEVPKVTREASFLTSEGRDQAPGGQ